MFFEYPLGAGASLRNTLIGHLVAVLADALSLAIFGLLDHPSILQEGMTLARTGAAALSMVLTGAVLLLLKSSHPPARASVLIVSLGLLQMPLEMMMLVLGVLLLTVVAWLLTAWLGFRCRSGRLKNEPFEKGGTVGGGDHTRPTPSVYSTYGRALLRGWVVLR